MPFGLTNAPATFQRLTLITAQKLEPLIQENPKATRELNKLRKQWEQAQNAVEMAKWPTKLIKRGNQAPIKWEIKFSCLLKI